LVLGEGFVEIKKKQNEKVSFAKFSYENSGDYDDKIVYMLKKYDAETEMDQFIEAVRSIYSANEKQTDLS